MTRIDAIAELSPNSEVAGMKNMSPTANEPPSPVLWGLSPMTRENKKLDGLSPRLLGEGPGGEGLELNEQV
ncbi:MAG: hypothetical protein DMG05_06385 [Acidobacteria bacterium]|nr:MAG: hypothetical protein DMG05_06385 [Acidobacteriota bacterium]